MTQIVDGGTVHETPSDFKEVLSKNKVALVTWNDITPLARNEWICWIESVKQEKTRLKHIQRALEDLAAGDRRPCCWMGCIHRTDKEISPSVHGILAKRTKNT